MTREEAGAVLLDILRQTKIPPLTMTDYETARELFAYVAVRDTLIQLNVGFPKADRLARICQGPPRARLKACLAKL